LKLSCCHPMKLLQSDIKPCKFLTAEDAHRDLRKDLHRLHLYLTMCLHFCDFHWNLKLFQLMSRCEECGYWKCLK
jgi:hypothetical protein